VINTKRSTAPDVLIRAAAQLGFYGREYERLVDVVIGGQYGSEGKGNIVAYLAPEYDVLVRVGGPNAGHKVYEEPEAFTHLMLPSGTRRNETASLVIGPGAVINVELLLKEVADCEVDGRRLSIDPQAMIISEEDILAEKALVDKIGSTGQGVGAATARKITGRSAISTSLAKDVPDLAPFVRETYTVLEDAFRLGKRVLLEGTQGTGLSIHHGDYPHVTSRDTTVGGCLGEAGISPSRVRRTVMVCRTYPIRVQSPKGETSGPMTGELSLEEIATRSEIPLEELKRTEMSSRTHKQRRIAEFDWVLLRRASYLNGPTDIALTFADYLSVKNRSARRFEQLTQPTLEFISEVERVALAPVSLISTRFHWRGIIDRRPW
jgi:adenylosuccinate synthase